MSEKLLQLKIEKVEKIVESKETDAILECLSNLELKATVIGEGDNSTVLVAEGTPFAGICLKKIKEKPKMICNDINDEHKFQIEARKAGVRTPLPLFSIKTKAENGKKSEQYLGMERIYGFSIGEIIAKPSLMPETFQYDIFCKALEDAIKKLHSIDIHHRSIHMQNIMIEEMTGLPVILDFGSATKGSGSDLTYEESVLVLNKTTGRYEQKSGQFEDDNKMVKNLCTILKQFNRPMN